MLARNVLRHVPQLKHLLSRMNRCMYFFRMDLHVFLYVGLFCLLFQMQIIIAICFPPHYSLRFLTQKRLARYSPVL